MAVLVKCADCGFLAVRHMDTRALLDAEELLRVNGEIPSRNTGMMIYDEWPVCFIRRANFRKEMNDNSGSPHRKKVLNDKRECDDGFTPWQQGLTPKEHLEMQLDHKWRMEQAEREREWRKEDIALAEKAMKVNIRSYLLAAVIGFAGALAAVGLARLLNS
jgi:hypothetical protein